MASKFWQLGMKLLALCRCLRGLQVLTQRNAQECDCFGEGGRLSSSGRTRSSAPWPHVLHPAGREWESPGCQGLASTWCGPCSEVGLSWAPGGDWRLRLALRGTGSTFSFPRSSLRCPELPALGQPGCLFSSYGFEEFMCVPVCFGNSPLSQMSFSTIFS